MNHSVVWADVPNEPERAASDEDEQQADVDETLAARRLRRWLQGMFGQRAPQEDGPPADR